MEIRHGGSLPDRNWKQVPTVSGKKWVLCAMQPMLCKLDRFLHHTCQHECTHSGHSAFMWMETRRSGGNSSRDFVPICLQQCWWPIGVSNRLMCSGHKACAQISPEFQHRSSFQAKQHSMALGLCIGCSAHLPTPVVTLHELKHHNYYHK